MGTTPDGGVIVTVPGDVTAPPPPDDYTLPEPRSDGTVQVPEEPPREVRDESPRQRLRDLPPVPRSCLDDDLTLLDVFAPYVSVPVRLMYCLLYVGTIVRVPSESNGGSSDSHTTVETRTREGDSVFVAVVPPDNSQRPLATVALVILLVVVAILIGYVIGRQRSLRE